MTVNHGTENDPLSLVDIIIVGAGFSGIGMGVRLTQRDMRSFVILERAEDLGGSWRDNIYPGVACDVPSPLYSYSFRTNPEWTRLYSPGAEIHRYIQQVAVEAGLGPHLRYGAEMLSARWDPETALWTVETPRSRFCGRYLITATGHLTDPKFPDIPNLETFRGAIIHSSRWDAELELEGAAVGVIGSGASAAQIVPALAPITDRLVMFQRSAPYVMPRNDREFTEAEKSRFRRDAASMDELRQRIFWTGEYNFAARRMVPGFLEEARAVASNHLAAQVVDPALREIMTPDYEIGCKRVLRSDDFYPALTRPDVTVEGSALARIEGGRAVSAAGNTFDLDVLIFATGFETWDLPSSHLVFGRNGRSLADHWSEGMRAYNSTTVAGFPNLFILNGPATSLGHNSLIYMIETQIDYVLGALTWMERAGITTVEVDEAAERAYADYLHGQAQQTVLLNGGCSSWYIDPRNGKATLSWPGFAHAFRDRCADFDPSVYVTTAAEPVGTAQ
ncbi:flavin-containing monooxygenase [Nocardia sp. alder85J]|uniref:flavin-containing monooxygenase n=1 Tax=Nocardia sp. alder85J TaxID=2862949 RepID=UPI001CD6A14C|nr:NAD(P)/FAD-dependent oxidoreductase [Nocardia sp. alder85J]MCX4095659.1 NAD(P)/FAD-dependent oxidoreductase [Nocardia sp. alder85J]